MRILHVTTSVEGGAGISCLRLHQGLLKSGVDSKILCFKKDRLNFDIQDSIYFYPDLISSSYIQKIKLRIRGSIYWRTREYLLKNKISEFDYFSLLFPNYNISNLGIVRDSDLLNFHWTSNFVNYREITHFKQPVFWTLHDMNVFTGGCHYANACNQFYSQCRYCPQLMGTKSPKIVYKIFNTKNKAINKASPTFICPSEWLKSTAVKSHILQGQTVLHIPYGLDSETFKPHSKIEARKKLNLPIEKKIILFVSDSIENKRKGFSLLAEVMKEHKSNDAIFLAIGKNEKRTSYNNVIYTGEIKDQNTLALAYSAADLFVIPSLEDNLPNTVLEAMSCGLPVIGFKTGGIPDMVKDGVNGFTIEVGNAIEMKNKIVSLLGNSELLSIFGNNSREIVLEKYTLIHQAESYYDAYKSKMLN